MVPLSLQGPDKKIHFINRLNEARLIGTLCDQEKIGGVQKYTGIEISNLTYGNFLITENKETYAINITPYEWSFFPVVTVYVPKTFDSYLSKTIKDGFDKVDLEYIFTFVFSHISWKDWLLITAGINTRSWKKGRVDYARQVRSLIMMDDEQE